MTKAQRSFLMSQVRSKDTKMEVRVRSALHSLGYRFRKNDPRFPGKPDIVFPSSRVAVFLDGDFWHGYRFHVWGHKLPRGYWQEKIARNRLRDRSNHRKLQRRGWRVVRVWEHQIKKDFEACITKIIRALRA